MMENPHFKSEGSTGIRDNGNVFLRPALRVFGLAHQRNVEIKKIEIYGCSTSLPSKLEKSFGRGEKRPLTTVVISLLNMEMMRLGMTKMMMEGPITLQLTYCCLV
jgi:hypothetical protein